MAGNQNRPRSAGPIGCDVADGMVRLAQKQRIAGGTQLYCRWAPLPAGHADDPFEQAPGAETAAQLIGDSGFRGREVVMSVPPELLEYRSLQLTPMPTPELITAVHFQLASELGRDEDEIVSDCFIVGRTNASGKPRQQVIAFGVKKELLFQHVERLESVGLVPVAIEVPASALARLALSTTPEGCDPADYRIIVDFDSDTTGMVIFGPEGIRWTRGLRTGASFLKQELKRNLGSDAPVSPELAAAARAGDDAPWPFENVDAATARDAIVRIDRQLQQNLRRELSVCLQHMRHIDRHVTPASLYVRGRWIGEAMASELAMSIGVKLASFHTPSSCGLDLGAGGPDDMRGWELAFGQAFYEEAEDESSSKEAA